MRLKIVQAGEAVLRQAARALAPAEILSADIQRLIADMRETMHDAPGVGLAAPQVGVSIQLAVVEDRQESLRDLTAEQLAERERKPVPFHALINPVIEAQSEEAAEFFEGCLSVAGYVAVVPRARIVRVTYLDEGAQPRTVEAHGWYARILQHEIDHLHGALYVDHMRTRTLMTAENYARQWRGVSVADARARLGVR